MSLVRVQTIWSGVAGTPYYTNLYALGPQTTNNGTDLANAWRAALFSLVNILRSGMSATIDNEILEFDETTGVVTGTGTTTAAPVAFTGTGDALPPANQLVIRWATNGIVHNRRVRGRTFLPGALETHNSATGTPNSVIGGPVDSAIAAMLTTMSGRMRIWAQPFEGAEDNPPRPGSAHAITGYTMAPFWGVLRSRRD